MDKLVEWLTVSVRRCWLWLNRREQPQERHLEPLELPLPRPQEQPLEWHLLHLEPLLLERQRRERHLLLLLELEQRERRESKDSDKYLRAIQMSFRKFLSEEQSAELGASQSRMKKKGYSTRKILLHLLWAFLDMLWANLRIKFDNLWLPSDRQIDD